MKDPATCADLDAFQMHYLSLSMDVDMDSKVMHNTATLYMTSKAKTDELILDIFRLQVHSVQVSPSSEDASVNASFQVQPFTSFGDKLVIQLPPAVATNETFQVVVSYDTQPDGPGIAWLTKEQTAGKTHPYMYTTGQEVLNRSIFPCQDSPSVRITYDAEVTVPSGFVCVMSAQHLGPKDLPDGRRTFGFKMQQSIPVYLVAMAVGNLEKADIGPRSSVWTEPCMLEAARNEFDGVPERYLQIGEKLWGEYRWERYDLVVMPPSLHYGGMENPRLTFVSPTVIAGDKSLCSLVAHEISHSWFGNLVTNATWSDFFLNEGFTMYAERRLIEETDGRAIMCLEAKVGEAVLREEILAMGEDAPLSRLRVPLEEGIDPADCYNECAYEKGFAFVSYLQHLVGSTETFDSFLREYCHEFAYRSIPAETMMSYFLQKFPNLADGDELNSDIKFSTWLHTPGFPTYTPDLSAAKHPMQKCETLAFYWRAGVMPVQPNILALSKEAREWPVAQQMYFLDCCCEAPFAHKEVVECLGEVMGLLHTQNFELMFRFAQLIVKNEVEGRLKYVGWFLKKQGKQKFSVPIYRMLLNSSSIGMHTYARKVFAATKETLYEHLREKIEAMMAEHKLQ